MDSLGTYHKPEASWEEILGGSITTAPELASVFPIEEPDIRKVTSLYPMLINPYYLGLISKKGDPIYLQAVPDLREVTMTRGFVDPLEEEGLSPVPGLTHKYPDRVLFLVSGRCAMFCRFCNRKRKIGRSPMVTQETLKEGISYIRAHKKIRDVLLSGGDPLLLPDKELFKILCAVRSIPHVEIIRIGTRVPCTLPQRITPQLAALLKGFHPLSSTPTSTTRRRSPPRPPLPVPGWRMRGYPWVARPFSSRGSTTILRSWPN